jgi:fucose permease
LNDEQAGRFFIAQFVGAIAGSLACGRAYAKWGASRTLFAGFAAIALGVGCIGRGPIAVSLGAAALYGIGIGFATPAINLLAAGDSGARRTANLNALNASWCVGALAGPPLILRLLATYPLTEVLLGLALFLALIASYFLLPVDRVKNSPGQANRGGLRLGPVVLLTSCFLFLYVGMENGLSGWLVSYGLRAKGMSVPGVAYSQAVFWGAILGGRLLVASGLRMQDFRIVLAGIVTAFMGTVLFVAAPNAVSYFTGIFVAGLGMSVIFPTAISVFMGRGERFQRSAGFVFACASLGGASVPWLMGRVSSWHDLQWAMWILPACGLLMLTLHLWMGATDQTVKST